MQPGVRAMMQTRAFGAARRWRSSVTAPAQLLPSSRLLEGRKPLMQPWDERPNPK